MIRVIIERKVAESMEREFHNIFRNLIHEAMSYPGYVSGEMMRNVDNPCHHVIISTWRSKQEWDKWYDSEDRVKILNAILPCLDEPETYLVLEPL